MNYVDERLTQLNLTRRVRKLHVKLTPEQKSEMIAEYITAMATDTPISQKQIGEKYGVTQATVCQAYKAELKRRWDIRDRLADMMRNTPPGPVMMAAMDADVKRDAEQVANRIDHELE